MYVRPRGIHKCCYETKQLNCVTHSTVVQLLISMCVLHVHVRVYMQCTCIYMYAVVNFAFFVLTFFVPLLDVWLYLIISVYPVQSD